MAGALTLAPKSPWLGPDAHAQAAECAWQRHSKQVVKQVRRDGRARRVRRTVHWWTCDSLPQAPVAAAALAPSPSPAPTPTPETEATTNRLGVKSAEYSYTLSRASLAAGDATIELSNQGEDAHNLNLKREGSEEPPLQVPETGSQEHRTAHFYLPAGTYRLWCSLPEHDELGMHATLVVEGG
jgi:plastocyanin